MKIIYTTQFKKDYKRIKKQNKDLNKLRIVVEVLSTGNKPVAKYRNHRLSGKWSGHRDCHIEPDWILIYRTTEHALVLERTGSHSELFK